MNLADRGPDATTNASRAAVWTAREALVVAVSFVLATLALGWSANPGPAQVNDTRAAAYASWSLGTQGTLALPEPWPASRNYWGVDAPDGRVYVNRFPGVAYWAAPAYLVADLVGLERPVPAAAPDRSGEARPASSPAHPFLIDLRPAAWTAAITVALAGLVAYALWRPVLGRRAAGAASLLLVFGTGLWPVAADALWPHGPSALLLLTVLWGWRRGPAAGHGGSWSGVVAAGLAAAGAVLVRPHLIVALVVLAAWTLWREPARRWAGGAILAGGAGGLLALSVYTWLLFGRFAPTAGYDAGSHLAGVVERTPWQTLYDLGRSLVGTPRGLLLFTPVAAVALVAVVVAVLRERGAIPAWTVASAVAGLAYLVIQVRAVGPLGGRDFFGPRTSLETLVLAAPLLAWAAWRLAARSRVGLVALCLAAAVSVGVNGYGAVFRSISADQVERWETIDATVRTSFGHLELGEVDLRDPEG